MNSKTEHITDTICPLCQNKNLCQAHQPAVCWCHSTKVPQALINNVPLSLQQKSCICHACIKRYNFALATRKT